MIRLLIFIILSSFITHAGGQTIDFTFETSNGLYCSPSKVIFKQACTGNPVKFIWSFGNNLYSNKAIDSTSYTTAGTYTVKLIATFATTTLELSKTVVINPTVTVGIAFNKNFICQPGPIDFTANGSGNVTGYEWDFGDGTAIVNTPSKTTTHAFTKFATNIVTLKATANSGCYDTTSTAISITKFPMTGTVSQNRGCIPAAVKFKVSATLPTNSTISSYTWNYGDGSPPEISNADSATHTYPAVGDYYATVAVTTSEGCTNTYEFTKLFFGTPPVNPIGRIQTNPFCASDSAVFIAKAIDANRYFWDFGDGTQASTTDTIIKHKYKSLGTKTVRVKCYYNDCGAPTVFFNISVIGVIANYSLANTCTNKNSYSFTDSSLGKPTSRLWDFGDGVQQSNVVSPTHSFPIVGTYATTLHLFDAVTGCSDTLSRLIYTAVPKLYSADSAVCKDKSVSFSILDNYTDTSSRYTWNIAGVQTGPVADTIINANVTNHGSFNNFVVIGRGIENCPDTVISARPLIVKGPKLNFTVPAEICLNAPLLVKNDSKPFVATDSIPYWSWDFGNATYDTAFQPAPFQYTVDGTYAIQLIAVDKNGCTDTLSKNVTVNPAPFLDISPAAATVCPGESVILIAFHNNNLLWSPSATLSCATCDTTIAKPPVSTKYYGTAKNSFNCSVRDSVFVEVKTPYTTTILPTGIYICQGESTTVEVNPKGKKILWSPAAGLSDATSYNPVISPTQSTVYTATLSDSAGCANSSSATLNVQVKSLPVVDAGPDKFYSKGESYSFTPVYSNNVRSYLWTPSDLLNCNSCPIPSGVATYNQKYILQVTSDSGCVAKDSVTISVDCRSSRIFMPAAFTPNNDNLNDYFYPMTIGIKNIARFAIYNRQGYIIYQATNFSPNDKGFGWNGKFKGINQSMGTYIYVIESICETGEKIFRRGSFMLVR
ncbi:MAG: PKD domain-containing protein [Ferruginibacter sp.]